MNHRSEEKKFKEQIKYFLIKHKVQLRPLYEGSMTISTDIEDSEYSFDMVFNLNIKVSVRIRQNKYLKYRDFTIRTKSANGGKTEIDKLIEGYGQLYFYGWLNTSCDMIQEYMIVDINKIRHYLLENGVERVNTDGTHFKFYTKKWLEAHGALLNL